MELEFAGLSKKHKTKQNKNKQKTQTYLEEKLMVAIYEHQKKIERNPQKFPFGTTEMVSVRLPFCIAKQCKRYALRHKC